MNGHCKTCDVEAQCAYPYKPTDCCGYRKFRPRIEDAHITKVVTVRQPQHLKLVPKEPSHDN